ncbi:hypothetical protein [Paramagnetospirillum magneticum]|uniref:Uncharacterized protein n=1 Tax=Paramagnetospirillum magneticum (strain ATCC 700264 / AMB-1) TaxID=342108 RepID=Q2W166_PARM1|nr:hypothetical protein [Paramagnetospirillum magneticum]BAE52409.1 hypothetical protein amb3605 [Paramagnetospirillum magneticum AMB-1]
MTSQTPFLRPIQWLASGGAEYPYFATVDGQRWRVRVNDFPAEALYTLLVDAREVEDFDDWPTAWVRPG